LYLYLNISVDKGSKTAEASSKNVIVRHKQDKMYSFSYFKEKDRQTILDFIEENPFAFMTGSYLSGAQVATQIPILLEERNGELYLQGHIMRNTDHHKAFVENSNALLVFTGPSCYVSASWYSNPQIGSTWNYMSVHVAGQVSFMTNEELIAFMRKLTLKFEKGNSQSLTFYDNLPEQFLNKMMPAIAGFEIKAEKIENVFKLSQNRDEKSYVNIIEQLEKQGGNSAMVAVEMKKRKEELFPSGAQWDPTKFDS
jgi:transcriptional regulator